MNYSSRSLCYSINDVYLLTVVDMKQPYTSIRATSLHTVICHQLDKEPTAKDLNDKTPHLHIDITYLMPLTYKNQKLTERHIGKHTSQTVSSDICITGILTTELITKFEQMSNNCNNSMNSVNGGYTKSTSLTSSLQMFSSSAQVSVLGT